MRLYLLMITALSVISAYQAYEINAQASSIDALERAQEANSAALDKLIEGYEQQNNAMKGLFKWLEDHDKVLDQVLTGKQA